MAKQAKQSAVILVTGDDDFVVDQKARAWVEAACPEEERAFGLEILDGDVRLAEEAVAVLGTARAALQTVGFFGGRKVVWLRRASMFGDGPLGQFKEVKPAIDLLTEMIKAGLPEGQQLVISTMKVDGKTRFYKACKTAGEIIDLKISGRPGEVAQQIEIRVGEMWRELDLQPASGGVIKSFVEIVGTDMRRLQAESEKLSSYLGPERRKARAEDIEAVVSAGNDSIAWTLQDDIGARNTGAALKTLRQLMFQGESAVGLIFAVESRIRELLLLRECMRRKWLTFSGGGRYPRIDWHVDAAAEARLAALPKDPRKIHPFRLGKLLEQANRFTFREILRVHRYVAETHERLVSASIPDPLEMELMILRITNVKV